MRSNLQFATLHWRLNGLSTWQEEIEVDQKEKEKFLARKRSHSEDGDPAPKRQKTSKEANSEEKWLPLLRSETEDHKEGSKQSFNQNAEQCFPFYKDYTALVSLKKGWYGTFLMIIFFSTNFFSSSIQNSFKKFAFESEPYRRRGRGRGQNNTCLLTSF